MLPRALDMWATDGEPLLATLRDVLRFYNTLEGAAKLHHGSEKVLQPLGLSETELDDLESFLRALGDGEVPDELGGAPPSPRYATGR